MTGALRSTRSMTSYGRPWTSPASSARTIRMVQAHGCRALSKAPDVGRRPPVVHAFERHDVSRGVARLVDLPRATPADEPGQLVTREDQIVIPHVGPTRLARSR